MLTCCAEGCAGLCCAQHLSISISIVVVFVIIRTCSTCNICIMHTDTETSYMNFHELEQPCMWWYVNALTAMTQTTILTLLTLLNCYIDTFKKAVANAID